MSTNPTFPPERFGVAALGLLTLCPVVLQGIWRPLAPGLGAPVDSVGLAIASVVVGITVLLVHAVAARRGDPRWRPGVVAALLPGPLALLLGGGRSTMAAVTVALLGVVGFCAVLLPWLLRRLPRELDGLAARRRGSAVAMAVLGLLAVTLTVRLSVFMGDASRPDLSLVPDIPFLVHHSCLTAYVEGAKLAAEGADNLYAAARWPDLNGTTRSPTAAGPYAPFGLDAFAYPPPFLLLPHALLSWLDGFPAQRALWFTLQGLCIAAGLWTVATWLGGRAGLRALLLAPAVWIGAPTLGTLQVGNVHAAVVVAAMLALVAFETRRPALGGALLAFAVVSKLSPGLLLVVLLVRGRYREVLWTAGFGLAFVVLGVLAFGTAPLVDFVSYQLPRLGTGEALTFLSGPDTVPINLSPFGLPFKLAALGVDVGDPWLLARKISRAFTVVLVGLTFVAARRAGGPRATAEVWAAVLTLAALQSPLAPGYALFPLLWLLSLRSIEVRGTPRTVGFVSLWLLLAAVPPLAPEWLLRYTLVQQFLIVGMAVFGLLRPSGPA